MDGRRNTISRSLNTRHWSCPLNRQARFLFDGLRTHKASNSPVPFAGEGCCTTRRHNTHGTEVRQLLYPWHPFSGRLVNATRCCLRGHIFSAAPFRVLPLIALSKSRRGCSTDLHVAVGAACRLRTSISRVCPAVVEVVLANGRTFSSNTVWLPMMRWIRSALATVLPAARVSRLTSAVIRR